jgi:hypothetical protein
MSARHFGLRLTLAILGAALSATQGRALDICVDSKDTNLNKDQCVMRGMAVMGQYFADPSHDGGAVFGFRGKDSAAAILCDKADKGVVFFATSSTDEKACRENILRLRNDF